MADFEVTQEDSEASQEGDCQTGSVAQAKTAGARGFSCKQTLLRFQGRGKAYLQAYLLIKERSTTYTQMPPLVGPRCVTGLHTE